MLSHFKKNQPHLYLIWHGLDFLSSCLVCCLWVRRGSQASKVDQVRALEACRLFLFEAKKGESYHPFYFRFLQTSNMVKQLFWFDLSIESALVTLNTPSVAIPPSSKVSNLINYVSNYCSLISRCDYLVCSPFVKLLIRNAFNIFLTNYMITKLNKFSSHHHRHHRLSCLSSGTMVVSRAQVFHFLDLRLLGAKSKNQKKEKQIKLLSKVLPCYGAAARSAV